jgi:SAM-dependent methyltransferase
MYRCNICGFVGDFRRMCIFNAPSYVIGAGERLNCICPRCGSIDRNRLVYYYLQNYTKIFSDKCSVLHVAPEIRIRQSLIKNKNITYVPMDIEKADCAIINLEDLSIFQSNIFDYVICNHVLEHVDNIEKCLSEMIRVCKPKGKIILSFPININDNTVEGLTTDNEQDRLRKFYQKDHKRLFGINYKDIFIPFLKVINFNEFVVDINKNKEFEELSLIDKDRLIILEKNKMTRLL